MNAPLTPPRPPATPLLGHVPLLWRDPLGALVDGMREQGDVVGYDCGAFELLLVNDADAVQHVLQKNHRNYRKSRNYRPLRLVLGDGLLTSEGKAWLRHRKLAQPAFHHRALHRFAEEMVRLTVDHVGRWRDGTTLDLHREMMQLTLRIVGATLFSADLLDDAEDIGRALDVVLPYAWRRTENPVQLPPWIPTPENLRFRRARHRLDRLVVDLVQRRRNMAEPPLDLLSMLMGAEDDEGGLSNEALRDEILTLVLAGHETTANALTFLGYLLALHPAAARRLAAEVDEVLGGRRPTRDDVSALTYTTRVVQEAMRIFPPVWGFEREAVEADVVGGYPVRPGTVIAVAPYTLHRHRRYWDGPEGFDPDRFSPERSAGRHRFAYLPFGGGPRICIGKGFAMMEAVLVVATVAQRWHLSLRPGERLELEPGITLRPRGGLHFEVAAR